MQVYESSGEVCTNPHAQPAHLIVFLSICVCCDAPFLKMIDDSCDTSANNFRAFEKCSRTPAGSLES